MSHGPSASPPAARPFLQAVEKLQERQLSSCAVSGAAAILLFCRNSLVSEKESFA